jgi:hypothetical protein
MSRKGWTTYKLRDLCQVTSSKQIFSEEYVEKGVPFYRSKEIIEKALGEDLSQSLYVSKERFQRISAMDKLCLCYPLLTFDKQAGHTSRFISELKGSSYDEWHVSEY